MDSANPLTRSGQKRRLIETYTEFQTECKEQVAETVVLRNEAVCAPGIWRTLIIIRNHGKQYLDFRFGKEDLAIPPAKAQKVCGVARVTIVRSTPL